MTTGTVFQMNQAIDARLQEEIADSIRKLAEITWPVAHDDQSLFLEVQAAFEEIINIHLDALADIILQARRLSYTIQHDIVSCQLFITLPVLTDEDALANYAFGLLKMSEGKLSILKGTKGLSERELLLLVNYHDVS